MRRRRRHKIERVTRIGWQDAHRLMLDEGYRLSGRRLLDPWGTPEFWLGARSKSLLMDAIEERVVDGKLRVT